MDLGIVGSGMIVGSTIGIFKKYGINVQADWCREEELKAAKKLQAEHQIPSLYTDYAAFLADTSFDVVYVGVVNSLHFDFAKKALLAGKHVICEKPFTADGGQARELVRLAKEKGRMIFECVMPRYSENLEQIREAIGRLGEIKLINCAYAQYSRRYDQYKAGNVLPVFSSELAGGALYDLNVYCLHLIMELFGEPEAYQYYPNMGYNGIDTSGVMLLDYGSFKAISSTAKECRGFTGCYIQGEKGYIHIASGPAEVKDITLSMNGGEEERLDVVEYEDVRDHMFGRIKALYDAEDMERCYTFIDRTVKTMELMEKARKEAGIYFGGESRA